MYAPLQERAKYKYYSITLYCQNCFNNGYFTLHPCPRHVGSKSTSPENNGANMYNAVNTVRCSPRWLDSFTRWRVHFTQGYAKCHLELEINYPQRPPASSACPSTAETPEANPLLPSQGGEAPRRAIVGRTGRYLLSHPPSPHPSPLPSDSIAADDEAKAPDGLCSVSAQRGCDS